MECRAADTTGKKHMLEMKKQVLLKSELRKLGERASHRCSLAPGIARIFEEAASGDCGGHVQYIVEAISAEVAHIPVDPAATEERHIGIAADARPDRTL